MAGWLTVSVQRQQQTHTLTIAIVSHTPTQPHAAALCSDEIQQQRITKLTATNTTFGRCRFQLHSVDNSTVTNGCTRSIFTTSLIVD